jgi:hypothetical protein
VSHAICFGGARKVSPREEVGGQKKERFDEIDEDEERSMDSSVRIRDGLEGENIVRTGKHSILVVSTEKIFPDSFVSARVCIYNPKKLNQPVFCSCDHHPAFLVLVRGGSQSP